MAFWANVVEAVCRSRGTLMAQPLLRHTNTIGALRTPAKLRPVWKSLALVAPSPKYASATTSSRRMRAAQAAPTAWGICVAMGELMDVNRPGFQASWHGIWCPCMGSPALPRRWPRKVASGMPRRSAAPCSR